MLKLPKVYNASGLRLKIKPSATLETAGATFFNSEEILIDKGCLDEDLSVVEVLLHEMLESSLWLAGHRYVSRCGGTSTEYLFSLNHKEFQVVVGEVARGMLDLIEAQKK